MNVKIVKTDPIEILGIFLYHSKALVALFTAMCVRTFSLKKFRLPKFNFLLDLAYKNDRNIVMMHLKKILCQYSTIGRYWGHFEQKKIFFFIFFPIR